MPFAMRRSFFLVIVLSSGLAFGGNSIQHVSVKPEAFNVALRQQATLSFRLATGGALTALVLDRDGFPVRRLVEKTVPAGAQTLVWDGRNDAGVLVPDEAYTFYVQLKAGAHTFTYFPAQDPPGEMFDLKQVTYDRREGLVSYTLPQSARVHCQAATAKLDPAGKKPPEGPVLRTIVDRQPRTAGTVVEVWDGYSESGDILVPELKNFVIGVACTPLPENAVIVLGNRQAAFREYAATRSGKSLVRPVPGGHHHHRGLTSLQDTSPRLSLNLQTKSSGRPEAVTVNLEEAAAGRLRDLGGRIIVFVDGAMVSHHEPSALPMKLPLPSTLRPGTRVLAVNWGTGKGPTAVGTLRLEVPEPAAKEARR